LRLGARLAGEVKLEFQEKTVDLVVKLEIPPSLKVKFLDITRSEKAVPALILALNDENSYVRRSAAEALGKIGNSQAVDALILALNDKDSYVRRSAAEALGKIGNSQAVDALILALNDKDSYVRRSAAEALGKIGNSQAVDALILALNDENSYVRRSAAEALGKIGNSQAVDALILALNDENSYVRRSAAEALGKIGNSQAVDALILALNDENSYVRRSAAEALGKIGNSQAVDALILALNDEDSHVRRSAAEALVKIGSPELLPRLTPYLKTDNKLYALKAITGIQNRCKYYNYEIYTSLAPEKQKPENAIIATLNTIKETFNTMSDTPKVQMNFHKEVYGVAGNVEGDQIVNAQKQNLAEYAAEIQQLLEQLAKNNQTIIQSDNQAVVVSAIHEEIKRNPTIKARLWNALKAGGTEALKLALDAIFKNPAVSISVETIKGYIEAE